MKALVRLTNPEEELHIDIDAWARLQFERNSVKHGVPPMSTREAAQRHPEMYMCICSYYVLKRAGMLNGASYDEFENRWGGVETDITDDAPDGLMDPTNPAQ